jgi:hypothetical protein
MSDIDLFWLIGQIGLVLLVGGLLGWLCRRRPYRDGRRAEILRDTHTHNYPGFEVISEEDMTRPTRHPVTETPFMAVPCDTGLDYGKISAALNWDDAPGTTYKPQGDDHTGGPAGLY